MHPARQAPEFKVMQRKFMHYIGIFKTLISVILALYIPI